MLQLWRDQNVVTGEGGMILTADEQAANRIKMLALPAMTKDQHQRPLVESM